MTQPFITVWKHRDLLLRSVAAEIQKRNAGTVFGRLWFMLTPVLFLGIYTVVYLYVFRLRPADMTPGTYVLRIFAGLVPLMAVSEALGSGVGSVLANHHLLKNTVFPILLVPLRSVIVSAPSFFVGIGLLVIATFVTGTTSPALLALPVVMLFQMMFLVGVLWVLSLVTFVLRDLQNVVAHVVMLLMISSPIAYTVEMVPERFRPLVWANPAAWFILTYQSIIAEGRVPLELAVPIAFSSLLVFVGGFGFFTRLRMVISNYG